jgi:hypothetical protein
MRSDKTGYALVIVSRHQNAGLSRKLKISNKPFENIVNMEYEGASIRRKNFTDEEMETAVRTSKLIFI